MVLFSSKYSSANYRPNLNSQDDETEGMDDEEDGEEEEEEEEEEVNPTAPVSYINPVLYDCYAISNHSGTLHGGHYTAYCRHPFRGGTEDEAATEEAWHLYNDRAVSGTSPDRVVTGEAYLMFFERKGHDS